MSLINDMLRNLEANRPDDLARQSLQREIRALPPEKKGQGGRLLLLCIGGLAVAGAVAVHQAGLLDVSPPTVAPPPPPPAVLVAPPAPVTPPLPVSQALPGEAAMQADESLRLASNQAVVSLPAAPILGVPDPVAPPSPATSAKTEEAAPASAPSGPLRIEKSPVAATPRDRADAEYRRAEMALASGRSGEALDGMRAALKIDPTYVQVRQALLRQLLDMRRVEDMMTVLREGIDLMPSQTGWAMSLARLQLEQGDLAAADRTLDRSQAYAEANADYAGFQGHLKSRLGAHRQAAVHYQRASRLVPNDGRWWLGLGLALEADGRAPEARDALRRALSAGSLNAELSAIAEQHLR